MSIEFPSRVTSLTRRVHRSAVVAAALLLTVCLFAASASATLVRYASTERLIELSDVIVHGRVVKQSTYFDPRQERVVTDTTIQIEHAFYGKVDNTLTLQQWGGEYKDRTYVIPGDATFEPDEEVVLFLTYGTPEEQGSGLLYLTALSQAKYKVYHNDRGEQMVARDLSNLGFLVGDGESARMVGHIDETPRTLKSFHATLQSLVAGIKGGAQ